jgi:hypothetical protein
MCCFSRPVQFVGSTRIFARFLDGVDQCVVYEMELHAKEDLAMILPIPVARPAKDDACKFVDLSGYTGFFDDLDKAFPKPDTLSFSTRQKAAPAAEKAQLVVQRVGSFDASFVPSLADFGRLDARFRLDDSVWKSLPQYRESGFAVFKLRKGNQHVHPMAFHFPTCTPGRLFFPTVHIHDGKVHETEEFDHTLYAQAWKNAVIKGRDWEESEKSAGQFVNLEKSKDLVWGGGHLYKRNIYGRQKNEDVIAETRRLG